MLSRLRNRLSTGSELACSFCGRSEHDVTNLVAGPRVFICDDCVDKCSAIIAAQRAGKR